MSIYSCMNLPEQTLSREIPLKLIVGNTEITLRERAIFLLKFVNSINVICSFEKGNSYLQVIEVNMAQPISIDDISHVIQRAIRYRVLFLFTFEDHYLILWRNFKISKDTSRVMSRHIMFSTEWLYKETLPNLTWNDCDEDDQYEEGLVFEVTDEDNGDYRYFMDELNCVKELGESCYASTFICARELLDWWESHTAGNRTDIIDAIDYLCKQDIIEMDAIESDTVRFRINEIEHAMKAINSWWDYPVSIGGQGRFPLTFFEQIRNVSTYDDEEELRQIVERSYNKYHGRGLDEAYEDEYIDIINLFSDDN